jgi:hypothetical protein
LGRSFEATILLRAVDYANSTRSPSFDSVQFYLEAQKASEGLGAAAGFIDDIAVDTPPLADYDSLYMEEGDDDE